MVLRLGIDNRQADHLGIRLQPDSTDAGRGAPRCPNGVLGEAYRFAVVADQKDVVIAVGQGGSDQPVVFAQVGGDDATAQGTGERGQLNLLDDAVLGGHDHVAVVTEFVHRHDDVDFLFRLQFQQVDDRAPARGARTLRELVDLEPVNPSEAGEAQDRVMAAGHEHLFDEVFLLGGGGGLAAPAAALCAVGVRRLRLGVAVPGQRDHPVLDRNEILVLDVVVNVLDLGAARLGILLLDGNQFGADNLHQPLGVGQDGEQLGNEVEHFLVVAADLLLFQAGQAVQPQLQDGLGLDLGQVIALLLEPEFLRQPLGAGSFGAFLFQQLRHAAGRPGALHQSGPGGGGVRRGLDQGDNFVDVGQRNGKAFQAMGAVACLAQVEQGAAGHHVAPVAQERLQHVAEVHDFRLAVDQGHHVDAERLAHPGLLVQVVEDDLVDRPFLQFDHDAHPVLVRFVAQGTDAFEALVAHQRCDMLDQLGFVDLVREFGDDDLFAFLGVRLDLGAGADHDSAPAGGVGGVDPAAAD